MRGLMTRDISPEREERGWEISVSTPAATRESAPAIPLPRAPAPGATSGRVLDRPDRLPIPNPQSRVSNPQSRIPTPQSFVGSRHVRLPVTRDRAPVDMGAKRYQLRGSEVETLAVVGTFRVVFARDLEHYPNERAREDDIRALHGQQLIERGRLILKDERAPVDVLTLTAAGKRLLESHRAPDDAQRFYAGWVRSVTLPHDAGIYRMATVERRRIESAGGHLTRIVLEHELSARVFRELYRPTQNSHTVTGERTILAHSVNPAHGSTEADRSALAAAHELPMADGHIRFPDVRLEYETATGERAHRDLELITDKYFGPHLTATRAAGFTLYHLGGTRSGGGAPYGPRRRRSVSR